MGLLAIMLNDLGYKAISLFGWQAGIQTDNNYTNSNIININTNKIRKYLDDDYIVIVAGFQGIDNMDNITTLGRGGSDTTATELAVYLNADLCEIYKDTECIYTADPKIVPTAKKINYINYEHILELSKMGAKVLAYKSIEYAKKNNLKLVIKSVENDKIGTIITNDYKNVNDLFISCTKKKYDEENDIISFITNENLEDIIKHILKYNQIKKYNIEASKNKVSIVLNNKISGEILKQIHDKLVLK